MALTTTIKDTKFGVGDIIRVHQAVSDSKGGEEKTRTQVFEGTVIKIKGRGASQSFTVRRIGSQKIGIEQIYPVQTPTIEKVEVAREGTKGSRHAKLYYTRDKSKKEIEKLYTRAKRRSDDVVEIKSEAKSEKPAKKTTTKKKVVKKTAKKKTSAKKASK